MLLSYHYSYPWMWSEELQDQRFFCCCWISLRFGSLPVIIIVTVIPFFQRWTQQLMFSASPFKPTLPRVQPVDQHHTRTYCQSCVQEQTAAVQDMALSGQCLKTCKCFYPLSPLRCIIQMIQPKISQPDNSKFSAWIFLKGIWVPKIPIFDFREWQCA